MNTEAKKQFELGVYTFGNRPRTADGDYGSTAEAIRNALEPVREDWSLFLLPSLVGGARRRFRGDLTQVLHTCLT